MDLHLQTDKTVLCIIDITHRLLDGLDAGTWRTEHNGVFAFCLGFGKIGVNGVSSVGLYLQQIGICLVGTVLIRFLARYADRCLASLFEVGLPEGIEI